jgi:hypothetical protein
LFWLSCNYTFMLWLSCNCILGQQWLASILSSWRVRLETATVGSLLLHRATPPLLPRISRWWEALAAAAPVLLLHPTTRVWRCGRCLLLLWHAWVTPPWSSRGTMTSVLTLERWAHMNTTSIFHLFSIITKCIRSFSDSNVRKQIGFCRG